jgi:S1-C subfamily serine protease
LLIITLAALILVSSDSTLFQVSYGQRLIGTQESTFSYLFNSGEGNLKRELFKKVSTDPAVNPSIEGINTQSADLTDIFKLVGNSVVKISSKDQQGEGSGFVFSKEGYIVTNNHVIEGAEIFDVIFSDRNTYTAKTVGKDPYNDVAVLKIIDDFSDQGLVPIALGNSSNIEVGQQVIAIGNPLGFSNTMTTGIVSQVGRLLPIDPETEGGFVLPNVIQTDAVINPGNSGGPMLNTKGEVVGINTSIFSPTGVYAGIGFAVPSNAVTRIVPVLIQEGHFDHPWLGFSGDSLNPDLAETLGFPRNYKGVLIESVDVGGPGDKAGLIGAKSAIAAQGNNIGSVTGDIIIALDGQPVKGIEDIIFYLEEQKSVGENVVVSINRNGEIIDLNAILQGRPVTTR